MPRLDAKLVADSLSALPGWSGDTERLRRTVELDDGQAADLVGRVSEAADAMDHHPQVDRQGGRVSFELWTHSAGGVTELDVALASRIDDLVLQVTGTPPPPLPEEATRSAAFGETDEVAEAGRAADPDQRPGADHDTLEPAIGAPSAEGGSPGIGGATLPDTEPGTAEPGIATPRGQGAPPAGQETE